MKKKILTLSILTILLSACSSSKNAGWGTFMINQDILGYRSKNIEQSTKVDPFNTSMLLKYHYEDTTNVDKLEQDRMVKVYSDEIVRLHKIFDRHYYYKDDNGNIINNLKVLNDSYGTGNEVVVDEELYSLIEYCIDSYEFTNGYFNIFTGSLTDFWQDCFDQAYAYEEIEKFEPYYNEAQKNKLEKMVEAIPNTLEEYKAQVTLNPSNHSITFNKLGEYEYIPQISLGGVAKGYATDLVKKALVEAGFNEGILVSGGSSLASLSNPIYNKKELGQSISVKNPNTYADPAFSLKISKEFAFSTSGNYTTDKWYRFNDNDNNTIYRHHIINPYTGYPMSYYRSVSILSYDLSNADLDIYSTTLMNMNLEDGEAFKNKVNNSGKSLEYAYLIQDEDIISVYASELPNFSICDGVSKYEK